VLLLVKTAAAAGCLGLESALYSVIGSHWPAVQILAACLLPAPLLVVCCLVETRGRALEDIPAERGCCVRTRGDDSLL
jgi:hypothetical protein